MRRRWDGDERGHGVAGGESHKPHAVRLVKALELADWVAEEPELHLLPHLERAALGLGFGLGGAAVDGATYELRLTWLGEKGRRPLCCWNSQRCCGRISAARKTICSGISSGYSHASCSIPSGKRSTREQSEFVFDDKMEFPPSYLS